MDKTLLRPAARRRRVRFFEWALASGHRLDGNAVTAVLGAKSERHESIDHWTAEIVREVLWLDVLDWCERVDEEVPPGVSEALWDLFDHLLADGALAAGSDPVAMLRTPLIDSGGLDRRGGRRHPSHRPAV